MSQRRLVELSSTEYADRRKQLVLVINQLRAVGAQAELDLPRVVVIGKQSAGKSSLIEAISGLDVPRDAGSCTRCPMECRLSYSQTWSCKISVRIEVGVDGRPVEKVCEIPFADTISDKSKVGDMLRLAQYAALHPNRDGTLPDVKSLPAETSKGASQFTKNVVCVDVSGPELTELSFIDLPGLIQNASDSDMKLVENLTECYIKGNCLILIVTPVNDDFENQRAWRLGSKEDPQGERTIGVLTKPDLLNSNSKGSQAQWLDVLAGRKHILKNGYFITKLADDHQRSTRTSSSDTQDMEADFFASNRVWSDVASESRIGVKNLVASLSSHLLRRITDSIPNLRAESHRLLTSCQKEISTLPIEIEQEPGVYLLELIHRLSYQAQGFVNGTHNERGLIQLNHETYHTFAEAINSTRPNFYPSADKKASPPETTAGEPAFDLIDMQQHISSSLTRELPNNVPYTAKAALFAKFQKSWKGHVADCTERVRAEVQKALLVCVGQVASRHPRLLEALQSIITQLVDKHVGLMQVLLGSYLKAENMPYTQHGDDLEAFKLEWLAKYTADRAEILASAKVPAPFLFPSLSFAGYSDTSSALAIRTNGSGAYPMVKRRKSARDVTSATPSVGTPPSGSLPAFPVALNPSAPTAGVANPPPSFGFSFHPPHGKASQPTEPSVSSVVDVVPQSQIALSASVSPSDDDELPSYVVDALERAKREGKRVVRLESKPVEEYKQEMELMAEVQAYFDVSHKRIVDVVPMMLDSIFVVGVADDLHKFLVGKLGLGTANMDLDLLKSYIADDTGIAVTREKLLAKRHRLQIVQQQLNNLCR